MKRTQVQLPEPLYEEIKRVAELLDWSIAEVLRRGAEEMVRRYPALKESQTWRPPEPRALGEFRAPSEKWRALAFVGFGFEKLVNPFEGQADKKS